jgi:uncharacterized protein (TIGR02117 family)
MNRVRLLFLTVLLGLWIIAPVSVTARTIYLVNVGWHVGIAVPVDKTLRRAMPESATFPDANFIEIGWGDRDFYSTEDPGTLLALKAAVLPTNAVVHLYGFSRPVAEQFSKSETLAIKLSDQEFAGLFGHIHANFKRGGDAGETEMTGPGLYGPSSHFYAATGEFHLGRTCNTWVAEALAAAGFDINPDGIITATGVMEAARDALTIRQSSR